MPSRQLALLPVLVLLMACRAAPLADGWSLEQLLRPPIPAEIAATRAEWAARDLTPADVHVIATLPVRIGEANFRAEVIAYSLDGMHQYGAVFLPAGANSPLPVILDIRGVEPGYPVRRLDDGPYSASVVTAPDQHRFAFAVPALRGHSIALGGQVYTSEGDQRDSWDGATDDGIGFLSAILTLDAPIDGDRVGAFGASRGGSVVLLMAARDPRIDAAVAFAPPTDWFALMARPQEDWLQSLQSAAGNSNREENSREAQFLEWFVEDRRQLSLDQARRRIIASSPLYFQNAGAAIQIHQGVEDRPVPVRNARALERRFDAAGPSDARIFYYANADHDLSETQAPNRARHFLLERLAAS